VIFKVSVCIANPYSSTLHGMISVTVHSTKFENRQFISHLVPTVFLHYGFIPVFTEL
jgi:predicted RNA binding protein with dsRBD fold (UPF0201 family)